LQKKPGKDRYSIFKSAVASLSAELSCMIGFCEVPLANPHVGAVLSMDEDLVRDVVGSWRDCLDRTGD
jgi:hypothetical protein